MILVLELKLEDEMVVFAVEKVVRDVLAAKAEPERATVSAAAAMMRVNMVRFLRLWKQTIRSRRRDHGLAKREFL
jgi:hypothetical protein